MTLHIPLLRHGDPYKSLDVVSVPHHRTREPFVDVSQANAGLVRRDLLDQQTGRRALARLSCDQLLEIYAEAAERFASDVLPLGETSQSPDDYVRQVSATTGLPHVLARRNMEKIRLVFAHVRQVIDGLTRRVDLRILDEGVGEVEGQALCFFPRTEALGVVLPSNSPGVHTLWLPAVALKIPLVLKPGSTEPWTPYRIVQALVRAGCPREAFGFYPTDHAGASDILRRCGRSLLFGDETTARPWRADPRVEVHGPGFSKIVIGEDRIDEWERYLDVMVTSIVDNAGRSCINASGIWVPSKAGEIAEALAERLARIIPRDAEDHQAEIAPFPDGDVAVRISEAIDQMLVDPGARDVTARHRAADRLAVWRGCSYLLPTIVHCERADHPLANREYLFPFASVVEVPPSQIPERLGPSLVVTAITSDPGLIRRLLSSPLVDRLNLGAIPTNQVSWDQPHEGNLFEHLYGRRAIQRSA